MAVSFKASGNVGYWQLKGRPGQADNKCQTVQCDQQLHCREAKSEAADGGQCNVWASQPLPTCLSCLSTTSASNIWILKVISSKKCIKTVDELVGCDPK